ncbi:MAG: hypothetical protein IJT50_03710, partial [Lentisphaeria bacterium]|nr:hypothetical protein [Lentisphaeria bacterium]
AYNVVVPAADRVPADVIAFMVKNEKAPEGTPAFADPSYGRRKIHYRKSSGNTRITIFEGGHNILSGTAFVWLMKQRKGKPAVWQTGAASGKAEKLTK